MAQTASRDDLKCVGVPGGWTIKTRDGRRCSGPLDDATARHYCQVLGIPFPGGES